MARAMSPPALAESIDVLAVIVDFADESRPTDLRYKDGVDHFVPFTVANAQHVFFDGPASTAARYLEMSHGLMTIQGDVIEVTIPLNIGEAELDDWRAAADSAAAGQGYLVANYDRVAYLVPYGYKNQIGLGGALGTWCWASGLNSGNAYLFEYLFNHELGHTIGLSHAHAITPGDTVISNYDQADLMGLADGVHAAAVNQWSKGWLDGARNAIHPIDGNAVYDIHPLADTASQLQVVHIDNHGAHPALGEPHDTWVTYRRPLGFDDHISLVAVDAAGQPLRHRVHVHHAHKSGSPDSYLARSLGVGDQYDTCGLSIQVNSIDAVSAEVEITQSAYAPVAPGLQVWPQGPTSVQAGTLVYYDLDVTNFDVGTGACEAYYHQDVTLPGPGWSAGWTSAGLDIALSLGDMQTFQNFLITAPVGTAPGMYEVSLELTNNGGSGAPVEATVNFPYEVLPVPDYESPTAPTNLVANEFHPNYVVLTWTPSTDNVAVHTYQVFHNGQLLLDGGPTSAYVDFPPPSGGYTPGGTNGYIVYAIDAAGNLSPPSNWAFVGSDTISPTTPTNLTGVVGGNFVALDWDDSTDNVGVANYDVHRNGIFIGTSTTSDWVDTTVFPGFIYEYTVIAWDGYGNPSGESMAFEAVMPPPSAIQVPSITPTGVVLLIGILLGSGLAIRRLDPENGRFTGVSGTSR